MIGGFRLGPADYFHHCLFIPTISFPGQYYKWGPLANFQAFFISGLPGVTLTLTQTPRHPYTHTLTL
jgi:hypothetical protein